MIHKNTINSSAKGAQSRKAATLGINTESSSPSEENPRAERYKLLSEARRLFCSEGKREGLEYPQNFHKTAKCVYSRFGEFVKINKSTEFNKSFFTGVIQCGKVFTCPVCAAKVQERRRVEISKAFDHAYSVMENKKVILVTLTFPHQKTDELKDLLKRQSEAFRLLRSGKAWQNKKQFLGFSGLIRSLEVTHSDKNGFHPHTHEAWIVNDSVDVEFFRDWLAVRWYKVCVKSSLVSESYEKLDSFISHSVQITDFASNSDYMAKMDSDKNWGADRELAKSNVKQAKGKGVHPYEFLNKSINGDTKAGRLFLSYAEAMTGKAQIFWSQGLKAQVGIDNLTDEEIAVLDEEKSEVLGQLDKLQWNTVVKESAQSLVLDLAETSGFAGVLFWLNMKEASNFDLSKEVESELIHANRISKNRIKDRAKRIRLALQLHTENLSLEYQNRLLIQEETKLSIQNQAEEYYQDLMARWSL